MNYDEMAYVFLDEFFKTGKGNFGKFDNLNMHGERAVLFSLDKGSSPLSAGEIASTLSVSTARVAVVLKSLAKKSFVLVTADKTDKRKTLVSLTQEGKNFIESQKQKLVDRTSKLLEILGKKDAKNFVRIMVKAKNYFMENIDD